MYAPKEQRPENNAPQHNRRDEQIFSSPKFDYRHRFDHEVEEQEADAFADDFVNGRNPELPSPKAELNQEVQPKLEDDADEEDTGSMVMAKGKGTGGAPPEDGTRHTGTDGSGIARRPVFKRTPGTPGILYELEADRLIAKIRADQEAAGMAESINARAFTKGDTIYFNAGEYQPETREGQWLLAHEMAHVAQGGDGVKRKVKEGGDEQRKFMLVEPEFYNPDRQVIVETDFVLNPKYLLHKTLRTALHLSPEEATTVMEKESFHWAYDYNFRQNSTWDEGYIIVDIPEKVYARFISDKETYSEYAWHAGIPGFEFSPEEIYREFQSRMRKLEAARAKKEKYRRAPVMDIFARAMESLESEEWSDRLEAYYPGLKHKMIKENSPSYFYAEGVLLQVFMEKGVIRHVAGLYAVSESSVLARLPVIKGSPENWDSMKEPAHDFMEAHSAVEKITELKKEILDRYDRDRYRAHRSKHNRNIPAEFVDPLAEIGSKDDSMWLTLDKDSDSFRGLLGLFQNLEKLRMAMFQAEPRIRGGEEGELFSEDAKTLFKELALDVSLEATRVMGRTHYSRNKDDMTVFEDSYILYDRDEVEELAALLDNGNQRSNAENFRVLREYYRMSQLLFEIYYRHRVKEFEASERNAELHPEIPLKKDYGVEKSRTAGYRNEAIGSRMAADLLLEHPNAMRVQATFYPQDLVNQFTLGQSPSNVADGQPLRLYTFYEEGYWYLVDFTDLDRNNYKKNSAAGTERSGPPLALFSALDHHLRFPTGLLYYRVPGEYSYRYLKTESDESWTAWLGRMAMYGLLAGIALSTMGASVPASVVMIATSTAMAISEIGMMVELAEHGMLSTADMFLHVVNVVASFSNAAGLSSQLLLGPKALSALSSTAQKSLGHLTHGVKLVEFAGDAVGVMLMTAEAFEVLGNAAREGDSGYVLRMLLYYLGTGGMQVVGLRGGMKEVSEMNTARPASQYPDQLSLPQLKKAELEQRVTYEPDLDPNLPVRSGMETPIQSAHKPPKKKGEQIPSRLDKSQSNEPILTPKEELSVPKKEPIDLEEEKVKVEESKAKEEGKTKDESSKGKGEETGSKTETESPEAARKRGEALLEQEEFASLKQEVNKLPEDQRAQFLEDLGRAKRKWLDAARNHPKFSKSWVQLHRTSLGSNFDWVSNAAIWLDNGMEMRVFDSNVEFHHQANKVFEIKNDSIIPNRKDDYYRGEEGTPLGSVKSGYQIIIVGGKFKVRRTPDLEPYREGGYLEKLTEHPNAHTLERHAPDVSDEALKKRAREGIASDGSTIGNAAPPYSPPAYSSRFRSPELLKKAYDLTKPGTELFNNTPTFHGGNRKKVIFDSNETIDFGDGIERNTLNAISMFKVEAKYEFVSGAWMLATMHPIK